MVILFKLYSADKTDSEISSDCDDAHSDPSPKGSYIDVYICLLSPAVRCLQSSAQLPLTISFSNYQLICKLSVVMVILRILVLT